MSLLPEFQIGWWNGWWYPVVFGLVSLGLTAAFGPRAYGKRLVRLPHFSSCLVRMLSMSIIFLFGRRMIIYSIFITMKRTNIWFYFVNAIFLLGLATYTAAMVNFAITPSHLPGLKGVYWFSRHPMKRYVKIRIKRFLTVFHLCRYENDYVLAAPYGARVSIMFLCRCPLSATNPFTRVCGRLKLNGRLSKSTQQPPAVVTSSTPAQISHSFFGPRLQDESHRPAATRASLYAVLPII
jgi:hypothetical protein